MRLLGTIMLGAAHLAFSGCARKPQQPNIVVIVIDTVRRDATGAGQGDSAWHDLTPAFDALAAEGQLFNNAWSTAPWTVPSHASMFTGLLPSEHKCTAANPRLVTEKPTLAGELRNAGYETVAFFSNPWLSDRATGLLRGFQTKVEAPIGNLDTMLSPLGDQGGLHTLCNVKAWLERRWSDKPFFMFVNLFEAHLPYDPPPDYRKKALSDLAEDDLVSIQLAHEYNAGLHTLTSNDISRIRRLYGGDVNTTDRLLGELLDMLREYAYYDDSMIIVVADHGENVCHHELMDHQFSVHEDLLAVPLAIRGPVVRKTGVVREDPVMVSDLYATVLDAAGLGHTGLPAHSRSLLGSRARGSRPLIAEYAGPDARLLGLMESLNPGRDHGPLASSLRTVRKGDLRLTIGANNRIELHDLAADPAQKENLADERPRDVEKLLDTLGMPADPDWALKREEHTIDEATRKQLESLGYVR